MTQRTAPRAARGLPWPLIFFLIGIWFMDWWLCAQLDWLRLRTGMSVEWMVGSGFGQAAAAIMFGCLWGRTWIAGWLLSLTLILGYFVSLFLVISRQYYISLPYETWACCCTSPA